MDVVIQPTTIQITSHPHYDSPTVLSPTSVSPLPMTQFQTWFTAAVNSGVHEAEAMALTTVSLSLPSAPGQPPTAVPSTRMVLLKQSDPLGFVFYTNYGSRKSLELSSNPACALCFYWREAHRSVRVVGRAEKVGKEESDLYFASRPRGSQVGAVASPQSSVVGEGELGERVKEVEERFEGKEVERPEGWGGWRIVPSEVEFWQGKPSRLHDRVRYLLEDNCEWKIERLAP